MKRGHVHNAVDTSPRRTLPLFHTILHVFSSERLLPPPGRRPIDPIRCSELSRYVGVCTYGLAGCRTSLFPTKVPAQPLRSQWQRASRRLSGSRAYTANSLWQRANLTSNDGDLLTKILAFGPQSRGSSLYIHLRLRKVPRVELAPPSWKISLPASKGEKDRKCLGPRVYLFLQLQ